MSERHYTGGPKATDVAKIGHPMSASRPVIVLIRELGERIAAHRLSQNLRQEDVARATGVSRSTVARLEAGGGGTLDTLVRVLQALGAEDRLRALVPDARVRPLDERPDAGQRKRASAPSPNDPGNSSATWTWDDAE